MGLVVYITSLRAGKSCGGYAYQRLGYAGMKFNGSAYFYPCGGAFSLPRRSLQPFQNMTTRPPATMSAPPA
jgi:hypothetical protein